MPKVSLKKWKSDLTSIIEELDESQYKKMLFLLKKVPKGQKTLSREDMVEIIIEHYGEMKSIAVIKRAMDKIPRKDAAVQGRLKPYVDLLKEEKKRASRKKSRARRSPLRNLEVNAAAERTCPPEQVSYGASRLNALVSCGGTSLSMLQHRGEALTCMSRLKRTSGAMPANREVREDSQ